MRISGEYTFRIAGNTHKEPKSMDGIAIMSSVSTPYDPSNDLPGSPGLGWVNFLAYFLGHCRQ